MAYFQALGTGPISFVDANQSQQELPLSSVFFSANGVDASAAPLFGENASATPTNASILTALLPQLVSQGFLAAGTQTVTPAAMTATAVQAGTMGNSITVQFASPSASAGTVAVTVTATEVYTGLTMTAGALATALGNGPTTATGLVYLLTESTDGEIPEQVSTPMGPDTSFQFSVPEAADNTKTAFTLAATNSSDAADANLLGITIAPDTSNPLTAFALTVSWTKTETVSLASLLTTSTNPFSYLVTFSGTSGPLPVAGTVTLGGGNTTTTASANIYASS
jgi:hypothetical protein